MRILLAANASYLPPRGGATRSNLAWLERLAERGHECRVVAGSLGDGKSRQEQLRDERLEVRVLAPDRDGVEHARCGGIEFLSTRDPARRLQVLRKQAGEFLPDWLLVSSEDLGHALLREASAAAPGRAVYLAHTPQWFPFGPESWNPDRAATGAVRRTAAVVVIGEHMAGYVRLHLGRDAEVVHPPMYPAGPYPEFGRFGSGTVAMFNPCAVKGISIFLALAERFRDVPFAVVPGWGTTAADRAALAALPNVKFLPNARDIDDLLSGIRILLMPSLWYEGFGLTAMEAMLRSIPVISSDAGGLVEAKRGTGYVIPVRKIERYEPVYDEHALPRAVFGETDMAPWEKALRTLLEDREAYERERAASREAAQRFVSSVDPYRLENLLLGLQPPQPAPSSPGDRLSPEKRALLLRMLKRRQAGKGG